MSPCDGMKGYRQYVRHLRSLLHAQDFSADEEWRAAALRSLNGEPGRELRHVVDADTLRSSGAFFTGPHLARRALSSILRDPGELGIVVDPACGAGDLLLSVARKLPLGRSVDDTCRAWGKTMAGCDRHVEFVEATKLRLAILAAYRHGVADAKNCESLVDRFPLIVCADGLSASDLFGRAGTIVVNPPFTTVDAPADCRWAAGAVNMAAVFIDTILRRVAAGTHVAAILPDVLRSGSRYAKWRDRISDSATILSVRRHGLFDRWADVDVFSMELEVGKRPGPSGKRSAPWVPIRGRHQKRVGDLFEIHVGAVVPHRHRQEGPALPYIHARSLTKWRHVMTIREVRRFAGTTFRSPFVAVRRTSSPSDAKRAVAATVTARGPIAVENHLLVLRPYDGRLETCRKLMRLLRSEATDQWLNLRIRCRHLTVSALYEMPWMEDASA